MESLPFLAGVTATVIFAASTLPMLVKARRTRDLSSYSLGNIGLANVGNLVHSVYVLSLPPGPIWALHGFYLCSTGLMLAWYLRYGQRVHEPADATDRLGGSPGADSCHRVPATSQNSACAGRRDNRSAVWKRARAWERREGWECRGERRQDCVVNPTACCAPPLTHAREPKQS